MPIYDYRCKECQFETEILQKTSEGDKKVCPQCKKETFERCVSAPRFRLGGGGWYETDEKPKDKQRNVVQGEGGCQKSSCSSQNGTCSS